jgi:hypothetical protein
MSLFPRKLFVLPNKVRQFVCRVEVFVRGAGEISKKIYRDRTIHERQAPLFELSGFAG